MFLKMSVNFFRRSPIVASIGKFQSKGIVTVLKIFSAPDTNLSSHHNVDCTARNEGSLCTVDAERGSSEPRLFAPSLQFVKWDTNQTF